MLTTARSRGLGEKYDLTLEATHHGPLLASPALYIEIGSTNKQGGDAEAADVWRQVISHNLGFTRQIG